jgi:lysophospholipase L1-like esterase
VIFATTTPVTEQNPHNRNEDIIAFNEALVPRLKELGVIINDLHALVYSDIDAYIRKDDNIHLTEEGIKVCAEQVARVIRETAAMLEP